LNIVDFGLYSSTVKKNSENRKSIDNAKVFTVFNNKKIGEKPLGECHSSALPAELYPHI
jgi:hypothetical protein